MDEILERQLLIRGRVFAIFSAIEKALAGRKKSFSEPHAAHGQDVVQACFIYFIEEKQFYARGRSHSIYYASKLLSQRPLHDCKFHLSELKLTKIYTHWLVPQMCF